MNQGLKHLAQQLMGGADLTSVRSDELDVLIDEYPYFAALHLLKAAKSRDLGPGHEQSSLSRAAIYFPNPHWLQCILEDIQQVKLPAETEPIEPVAEIFIPEALEEPLGVDVSDMEVVNVVEQVEEQQLPADITALPEEEESFLWENNLAENPVYQQHVVSDEEHFEQEIWHRQETEDEIVPEKADEEQFIAGAPLIQEMEEPEVDQILRSEIDVTSLDQPITGHEGSGAVAMAEPSQVEAEPEMAGQDDITAAGETPDLVQEKAPEQPLPELTFEPLYTIDYFASQGIKIPAEASPKDQLTLKLRSFTEWLRAMKKIHPEKMSMDFKPEDEDQVRTISETSNSSQQVYTEAMAEVFLKQGKKDKALEVFEKLSLLDPSKSAYFAVRIQEIKEN